MTAVRSADLLPVSPINGLILVGVCAAGKTTAKDGLKHSGIPTRSVAQEHSLVKHLYRQGGMGLVVLLVASWETVHHRRQLAWNPDFYRTEWMRLQEARKEAHLILHTDHLSRREVADAIIGWWDSRLGLGPVWLLNPEWNDPFKAKIRSKLAVGEPLHEILARVDRGPSMN